MREREGLQVRAEQAGYTAELPVRPITLPSPLLPFLLFCPNLPRIHAEGPRDRTREQPKSGSRAVCCSARAVLGQSFVARESDRAQHTQRHATPLHAERRHSQTEVHWSRESLLSANPSAPTPAICCLLPAACRLLCLFASPTCCSRLASEPTSPRIAWLSSFSLSLWLRLSPFLLHLSPRQRSNCRTYCSHPYLIPPPHHPLSP